MLTSSVCYFPHKSEDSTLVHVTTNAETVSKLRRLFANFSLRKPAFIFIVVNLDWWRRKEAVGQFFLRAVRVFMLLVIPPVLCSRR